MLVSGKALSSALGHLLAPAAVALSQGLGSAQSGLLQRRFKGSHSENTNKFITDVSGNLPDAPDHGQHKGSAA